jgi:hypothetical protein
MQRPRFRADLLAATTFVLVATMACVSVNLGSSSAPPSGVQASGAVAEASDAPSVGPKRTRKPRRNPPSAPTDTTQPTTEPIAPPTEPPTVPPTLDPNATPFCCFTFHLPPIGGLQSLPILQPIDLNPKLDYTKPPNYGEANLGAGFTPDPYSVGMTSGGPVDVSYLGSSCSGFATQAPDLRINFSGGGAALLRLYFISASGDTTMVVNDPYGNFYCVDDSFGTVNPTIDFNNPAGGSYDVWIGSYASGTNVSGTFYVTESSGNHP